MKMNRHSIHPRSFQLDHQLEDEPDRLDDFFELHKRRRIAVPAVCLVAVMMTDKIFDPSFINSGNVSKGGNNAVAERVKGLATSRLCQLQIQRGLPGFVKDIAVSFRRAVWAEFRKQVDFSLNLHFLNVFHEAKFDQTRMDRNRSVGARVF